PGAEKAHRRAPAPVMHTARDHRVSTVGGWSVKSVTKLNFKTFYPLMFRSVLFPKPLTSLTTSITTKPTPAPQGDNKSCGKTTDFTDFTDQHPSAFLCMPKPLTSLTSPHPRCCRWPLPGGNLRREFHAICPASEMAEPTRSQIVA